MVHVGSEFSAFQEITKVLYGKVEGQELTVKGAVNSLYWLEGFNEEG